MGVLHNPALLADRGRPAAGEAPRASAAEGLEGALPEADWDMRDLRAPLAPPVEVALAVFVLVLLTLLSPLF
ncbi:hypothetical protein [Roseomonas sp. BN140053]|uniref:hypothetical protein n=1 Tax=Roseomonas sp. BN140053 TaxID=3391898 RepID=UPI0039E961A0